MMKLFTTTAIGLALCATGGTAFAGGLDRATFGSSILFEKGTYAELSFATTNPDVAPSDVAGGLALSSGWEVASAFDTAQFGIKTDLSDKLSLAFTLNSNPFGVDIDYADFAGSLSGGVQSLASLKANLSSRALTALARYKFTDRISAFGALKYQTVSGTANVTVPLVGNGIITGGEAATGAGVVSLSSDSSITPIIGVAYEIPKIALRVAASFEKGSELNPIVNSLNPTFSGQAGVIATPDAFLLEFQSGIAANTLLFGSIRHSKWSDAQVTMGGAFADFQLSDFDDSTTYNIGVGRKFSEKFSGSLSLTHAPSDCSGVSLLAPTCTQNTLSVGGKYSLGNGAALSGGVSFRKYETATSTASTGGIVFGGNTLMTVGMKISKSF
jgi:long-subunit fatty acid transport protein